MGMYVVTQNGKKLPVDDSSIDYENEYISFKQSVGLYTDDTILRDVWVLSLFRNNELFSHKFETEFVKEYEYDHEPSKEEILWAMAANGLSRDDIAIVEKAYTLDMEGD